MKFCSIPIMYLQIDLQVTKSKTHVAPSLHFLPVHLSLHGGLVVKIFKNRAHKVNCPKMLCKIL